MKVAIIKKETGADGKEVETVIQTGNPYNYNRDSNKVVFEAILNWALTEIQKPEYRIVVGD